MSRATTRLMLLLAILGFGTWAFLGAYAADPPAKDDSTATAGMSAVKPAEAAKSTDAASTPAVQPKPISPNVQKGLDYLFSSGLRPGRRPD